MALALHLPPIVTLSSERRLVIGDELGRGNHGAVHVARLEQVLRDGRVLARPVAVKIVDPGLYADSETMHSLTRSVRRSLLVRHPNVVQVTDYLESTPCIVQELVEGLSLAGLLARWESARRRIPLDLALFVACEVAEGLAGARSTRSTDGRLLNMAHHNLSARQVLLSWHGEVKVGDFGWQPTGATSGVRRTSHDVRDQIAPMAPEVALGSRGDGQSDVFSLAVMIHEMLYGPRFPRGTSAREMFEIAREGIVKRPVIAPVLPAGISEILARALEFEPHKRQAHAGVLAYDLRREALALGVADGRMFLRTALFEMSEGVGQDTEP